MFEKWIDPKFLKKNQKTMILILMGFFILCAWMITKSEEKSEPSENSAELMGLDTFIPNGFVLVPIEIQNLNALDSIIGQYGVVDLYPSGSQTPIAKGLRLLRSPRDPSQFAVLVNEQSSQEIVRHSQKPFLVVVQNRSNPQSGTLKKASHSRIVWED